MASGYYKYRCKNFYSHNCGNWVWVNNTACAECVAAGRDSLSLSSNTCGLATLELCRSLGADSLCHESAAVSNSKLSLHPNMQDHEEEFNDEAPVRPRRDPCNHFHSGYL